MKIIFYGPIGGNKSQRIGGGESGNKKTIALLENLNFDVEVIEKPYPIKIKYFGILLFPIQLIIVYLQFVFKILLSRNLTFHLSGFYNHLIYIESLFIVTSKLFRVKSVYEMRAGGAIESYFENTFVYRFFFKKTLQNASFVLCQGEEYLSFIKSIANVEGFYYPNFIQDKFLLPYNDNSRSLKKTIEIVYFGRIVESKNIEFILEICQCLKGKNFRCEIIGDGDEAYIQKLIKHSITLNIAENIIISPPHNASELLNKLKEKHFFLFPSKEKREGHSNSLTEAMSVGVVPLVSTAGFNPSIVKDQYLVIDEFEPRLYAEKINFIWKTDKWYNYSNDCYLTVVNNFTEKSVKSILAYIHER